RPNFVTKPRRSWFITLLLMIASAIFAEGVEANSSPNIWGWAPRVATAGEWYEFTPNAGDPDGDSLSFSIKNKPDWAWFSSKTGRLRGTPKAAGTFWNIVISVSDGRTSTSLSAFSIKVEAGDNSPPNIWGWAPKVVTAGQWYEFTPKAGDPDGDPLTFSIKNKPDWAWFDNKTGRFRGTPPAAGTYGNIVISVSDGIASTSLPAFTITAEGGDNSSPNIWGWAPKVVTAGQWYEFTPKAGDPDGDPLTFSIKNKPDWAWFDNKTGRFRGTPPAAGIYGNIVISVSDGQASASLSPFSITVEGHSMGSATLSWTPPMENTDGTALTDLAGYRIYWGQTAGNYPNSVSINNPGITTYVIENLASGSYTFVATSFNTDGVESGYSAPATKTVQ
ncbi:MAG: putative Ig domain-containing protein, partial [Woeseia sp.]